MIEKLLPKRMRPEDRRFLALAVSAFVCPGAGQCMAGRWVIGVAFALGFTMSFCAAAILLLWGTNVWTSRPLRPDVLQTVFVRLLQRASGSEAIENVGSFLHRSAVNAGLDVLRARRNIRGVPLDDLEPVLAESPHRGPDRAWDSLVIQDWLREALARLNPRIAQMFILRFFEGKENREIAAILNTTPGTVAVTISRTRDKLRQEYRERAGGVA